MSPDAALEMARSTLGIAEDPPGSNLTPIGEEFGWNGVAWCDEWVSVILSRIGVPTHFASCWLHIQALKSGEAGEWLGKVTPVPGDLAFYGRAGSDHINIVEYVDGDHMVCIGGNELSAVRRSRRLVSSAYGFGRPHYGQPAVEPPAPEPEPPAPVGHVEMPLTVQGHRGRAVSIAQVTVGATWVDGDFGPDTAYFVRNFQRIHGLTADGDVGDITWTAMIQALLGCGVDGKYGPITTAAVIDYQTRFGLGVDGIAGFETFGHRTGQ